MPCALRRSLPLAVLLSSVLLPPAFAQDEPEAIDLFAAGRPNRAGLPTDAAALGLLPDAVGAIEVFDLSLEAGSGLRSGGPGRQRLRIALPDGSAVTCDVSRSAPVNGVEVMEGTVGGNPEDRCALFVKDGEVTGDIARGGDRYRVVPLPGGNTHAVVEVRTGGMSEGGGDAPVPRSMPRRSERSRDTAPRCDVAGAGERATIDVLVLYTPRAAAKQDMDLLIAESMNQLDSAARMYPGDRFGVTFRLVGAEEVDYREGKDLQDDLNALSGIDPGLTGVPALRDRYKADLVHLIVEGQGNDGSCGIGWMIEPQATQTAEAGFSVSDYRCSAANLSFAHEIGHNIGMNHDRYVVDEPNPADINFGYVSLEDHRRTLMAYGNQCYDQDVDCPRVVTYSTPDTILGGDRRWGVAPDGVNPAYNREILCRYAPEVAKYR